jgi:hypothetical protein
MDFDYQVTTSFALRVNSYGNRNRFYFVLWNRDGTLYISESFSGIKGLQELLKN